MSNLKSSRSVISVALVSFMTMASTFYASEGHSTDLWGASSSQTQGSVPPAVAVGAEIGNYVRFQGVGTVFYAGQAGGEVYFAELDEPGVFAWEEALEACSKKGQGWSVPTAPQLSLLSKNSEQINFIEKDIRGTQGYWYWSASSVDSEFAMRYRAYDGLKQPIKKKFAARVRCVRVY